MKNGFNGIADFICREIQEQQKEYDKCSKHRDILAEAMAEVKAVNDRIKNKELGEIIDGCIKEIKN